MKKIILLFVLITVFSFDSFAQSGLSKSQLRDFNTWKISVGVNAVGSLGTRNPVERIGDFQFKQPLALAVEHQWSRFLSIEQDFTLNKFDATTEIDNAPVPEDYTYISSNTYLKYYASDKLFPETTWLDLYAGAGFGVFHIDELNTSANILLGGGVWFSPNFGLRLQGVGKFAFNHKDSGFDNNHFQYMLQAVFKL